MKVFDNYEISPCKRYEEPASPGKFYFEVCEPPEADVWTLYGHINGEGVQAIGDFDTREQAEEAYFRITGQAFPGSCQSADWLRVMHTGQKLLEALVRCNEVLERLADEDELLNEDVAAILDAREAIAEATGRAA